MVVCCNFYHFSAFINRGICINHAFLTEVYINFRKIKMIIEFFKLNKSVQAMIFIIKFYQSTLKKQQNLIKLYENL